MKVNEVNQEERNAMKVHVQARPLFAALQAASILAGRNDEEIPILRNATLLTEGDHLLVVSTDLQTRLTTRLPATVERHGEISIPAKDVAKFVKQVESAGVVLIEATNNAEVALSAGRSICTIDTIGLQDVLPVAEYVASEPFCSLGDGVLNRLVRGSSYALPGDKESTLHYAQLSTEPGVHLEFAATDGHRMAMTRAEFFGETFSGVVLIPAGTVTLLEKIAGESMATIMAGEADGLVTLRGELEHSIHFRLPKGKFPSYSRLFERKHPHSLTIGRKALIASLDRLMSLGNEAVACTLAGSLVRLVCSEPGREIADILTAMCHGGDRTFGINGHYLKEAISRLSAEHVRIEVAEDGDESTPILVLPEPMAASGNGTLAIVMGLKPRSIEKAA